MIYNFKLINMDYELKNYTIDIKNLMNQTEDHKIFYQMLLDRVMADEKMIDYNPHNPYDTWGVGTISDSIAGTGLSSTQQTNSYPRVNPYHNTIAFRTLVSNRILTRI